MKLLLGVLPCCLALFACAAPPIGMGHAPDMSQIGPSLQSDVAPITAHAFPAAPHSSPQSLWDDDRANLFRDVRATRVGDVLTVNVAVDDKAKLGNSSDRTTTAIIGNGFDVTPGIGTTPFKVAPQLDINSSSAATGIGDIDRSEQIALSVAAVVTAVLPNGNILISGSQEMRVNDELRIIDVAGIARPRDLSKDNSISYSKLAEARISYGGRGRMSEVQQPGVINQLYDAAKPF